MSARKKPWYQFADKYDQGIAVGTADIRNDMMDFSFRNEKFRIQPERVYHKMIFNGYFYEIPIKRLREIAKGK